MCTDECVSTVIETCSAVYMSAKNEKNLDMKEVQVFSSSCLFRRRRRRHGCSLSCLETSRSSRMATILMMTLVVVLCMIERVHWTYRPGSKRIFSLPFSSPFLWTLVTTRRPSSFLLSNNNKIFVSASCLNGGTNKAPAGACTTRLGVKVPRNQCQHHGQTIRTRQRNMMVGFVSSEHHWNPHPALSLGRQHQKKTELVGGSTTGKQVKNPLSPIIVLPSFPNARTKWACSNIHSFSSLSSTPSFHNSSVQSGEQSLQDSKEENTDKILTLDILPKELSQAFSKSDTDGILEIAPKILKQSFTGQELIESALHATQNQKGQAAAILNGLLASCTHPENENTVDSACCAWDIYTTWEELQDELDLYPDLVTFCCTYSALKRAAIASASSEEKDVWFEYSQHVLERAQRYSKKAAGSKRRKLLNTLSRKRSASKRKHSEPLAKDHLEYLQDMYGEHFDILYEDNNVVVVNKPSGMTCYHTHKTTSGKIKRKKKKNKKAKEKNGAILEEGDMDDSDVSLEDALLNVGITLSTLNPDALGIVHRIDRGTSGCVVLAKNDDAHARLLVEFFTRRVQKQYTALVPFEAVEKNSGRPIEELKPSGVIDEAVGGKSALSLYKVAQKVGSSALLLDIQTKTGRKHQVRVHCACALGRPIFLDPLYNDVKKSLLVPPLPKNDEKHFCLHASMLTIDEFDIKVQSSLPTWWTPLLETLKKS